ncbi:YbaB/EbfC family nucleoid-associated protein [Candidatus Falkowbacteria bacterium]|nr:YbaB/EbfC family nucleoid-associated protein [Candidatus Falkowbacteria bacterium]
MFNKLKQIKDLRDQAKTMQNALAKESVSVERGGVKIEMNGNLEVTVLTIADGSSKESTEKNTKEAINEAIKKTQKLMAQKLQEMGGFPGLM